MRTPWRILGGAILAAIAVEVLARTRYGVWADRIAVALLALAVVMMLVRRFRQTS